MRKCIIDETLKRIAYLTIVDYPVNWLEKSFMQTIQRLRNVSNIDELYSIFYPELEFELNKNNKNVSEYLSKLPYIELPNIEYEGSYNFSQRKLARLLTELWEKVVIKINNKKEKEKTLDWLIRLKILHKKIKNAEELPFDSFSNYAVMKFITFKVLPENITKGTALFISAGILYYIQKGIIHGKGADKLSEIVKYYACKSSRHLGVSPEDYLEFVNYITGDNLKISFC